MGIASTQLNNFQFEVYIRQSIDESIYRPLSHAIDSTPLSLLRLFSDRYL